MSEELETVLEEVESIPETNEAVEQESTESQEQDTQEHKEPEIEKPWKKEKTVPESIPYSRFSEVNAEKRELERRLAEYENKLSQYNQLEQKTKEITSVEELTAKAGEMDLNEYTQALLNIANRKFEEDRKKEAETARMAAVEKEISEVYINRITESAKKNPEITEAAEYLTQNYAKYLPRETRYALVTDEHVGEVIYEIATNKDLINFICTANPIDAARKIAKISAKYDADISKSVRKPQVEAFVPKNTPTGSPKISNSAGSSTRKYTDAEIARMSSAQYRKAKADGRI